MLNAGRRSTTLHNALAFITIAGCSSSTEPGGGPAHLVSTITVSESSVPVGGLVNAQWTIENTGAEPLHHAFGASNASGFGLEISVTPAASVLQSQGSDVVFTVNDSLNLAPHARLKLNAAFLAIAVGSARVVGCLPPDSGQTPGATCASADVRVVSGF